MARRLRVVHYINQFFGQIGGEDHAGVGPQIKEGPLGPGRLLQQLLGDDGDVVATAICGDNYFVENLEKASNELLKLIKPYEPDLLIAGPAFNAGRYGPSCGQLCQLVQKELGIPAVTGMFEGNPGVDLYRKNVYIVRTADSARGMAEALQRALDLGRKMAAGAEIGLPAEEGYFPRGVSKNIFSDKNAAQRAVATLMAKLNNQPFTSEMTPPVFDNVAPCAPVTDLGSAIVALVTDGGLVLKGNPDKMPAGGGSRFSAIQIEGLDDLSPKAFEAVHGGYDVRYINDDPDRLVPLDVVRQMEKEGAIGKLLNVVYATAGLSAPIENARRTGRGIAEQLKKYGVQGAILTST